MSPRLGQRPEPEPVPLCEFQCLLGTVQSQPPGPGSQHHTVCSDDICLQFPSSSPCSQSPVVGVVGETLARTGLLPQLWPNSHRPLRLIGVGLGSALQGTVLQRGCAMHRESPGQNQRDEEQQVPQLSGVQGPACSVTRTSWPQETLGGPSWCGSSEVLCPSPLPRPAVGAWAWGLQHRELCATRVPVTFRPFMVKGLSPAYLSSCPVPCHFIRKGEKVSELRTPISPSPWDSTQVQGQASSRAQAGNLCPGRV